MKKICLLYIFLFFYMNTVNSHPDFLLYPIYVERLPDQIEKEYELLEKKAIFYINEKGIAFKLARYRFSAKKNCTLTSDQEWSGSGDSKYQVIGDAQIMADSVFTEDYWKLYTRYSDTIFVLLQDQAEGGSAYLIVDSKVSQLPNCKLHTKLDNEFCILGEPLH